MNKPFTAWDQDALRKAMAASVRPDQKPKKQTATPQKQKKRADSFASKLFNFMRPGVWHYSRDLSRGLEVRTNKIATTITLLRAQGRVEREKMPSGVYRYRRPE